MVEKMRVLLFISNLKIAGAQKMVEQLAINIDRDLIDLKVLVLSKKLGTYIENRLEGAGIDVTYLNKPGGLQLGTMIKAAKFIVKFKPDIIHSHVTGWIYSFIPAAVMRIPIMHTIHSQPKRQETGFLSKLVVKLLYRTGKMIPIAISNQIAIEAKEYYKLAHDADVVYNPVDYKSFAEAYHPQNKETTFVNVARFNPLKNQAALIDAFSRVSETHPDIKLKLAGDGELLETCMAIVNSKGLTNVTFLGNIENVPSLFKECDVFVLSSTTEGLPVSLLEAEAAGLPVIAPEVGGIPDIVNNNGILYTVKDYSAMENALEWMSGHCEERTIMAAESQQIALKYSSENIARQYTELYMKYRR